jgi:DNA-binding transcriptional ArsR family regulator
MRAVVIGDRAAQVRRTVGSTSWMVLEELLVQSTGPAKQPVAGVSVRALAASLGLAKGTVVRAIRRLRDAGLVTFAQQRTAAGIFDAATYAISLPEGVAVVDVVASPVLAPERVGRQVEAAAVGAPQPAQLSLLAEV